MTAPSKITAFQNLLRYVVLGDFSANKGRYVLTVLGIALGIGIFVAVETAHVTIQESFSRPRGYVPGMPDLHVAAGEFGFDEGILTRVQSHPAVRKAQPMLAVPVTVLSRGTEIPLLIYGADFIGGADPRNGYRLELGPGARYLDLILDPEAVLLHAGFAREHGLNAGDRVQARFLDRILEFRVLGVIHSPAYVGGGNRYGVLDIAWAQQRFDKIGLLDRIDVYLWPGSDLYAVERELNEALPGFLSAYTLETSGTGMMDLVSSFQLNITALSLISLLVGMFLIYNTIFISYIRKRRQIGILRSLGVTRAGIFWIFSAESLVYGFAGGLAGIGFGYVLSFLTVDTLATTVNTLYAPVETRGIVFSPRVMTLGLLMGLIASFLSSMIPAMEAARTSQAETLRAGMYEVRFRERHPRLLAAGLALLGLSVVLAFPGPVWGMPLFGYGAIMALMLGMTLVTPSVIGPLSGILYRGLRRFLGAEGFLAHGSIRRNLGRSSVILCAIMVSLGMMVSFVFMIHSFRNSLADLIDQVVRFQFYLTDRYRVERGVPSPLPAECANRIRSLPGVSRVEGYTLLEQAYRGGGFMLMSADMDTYRRYDQIRFLSGSKDEIYARARAGGILISEALSSHHDLKPGDFMEFETPGGSARFRVDGVFYNYQFERGMAYLDREVFERYYPPDRLTGIYVYVDDPAREAGVREALEARVAGPFGAVIITRDELKSYIMDAFEQTFAITYALQVMAIVVAVLAIVNTLSAAILERQREIAILRAIGAFRAQVRKTVILEAGMVGAMGCVLGVLLGFLISMVLIFVVNKQAFGWSIQFHIPLAALVQGTLLVFATTVLAGVFPAARAARANLTEAFRYE